MTRVLWWLTVGALVAAVAVVPRWEPEPGESLRVREIALGERADVRGGRLGVHRITASRTWTDGSQTQELTDGYFVEVSATVRPEKAAASVVTSIRSRGRIYEPSDRSPYTVQAEPGFDTPVTIVFEVPDDVLGSGSVWLRFVPRGAVHVSLDDDTVDRVDVVEERS